MRFALTLLLSVLLFGATACSTFRESSSKSVRTGEELQLSRGDPKHNTDARQQNASLDQADAANVVNQAIERKIIRNANLTVEVVSPTESQRKIVSIAESHQGFVVASEATQSSTGDKSKTETIVNLVVRVPAARFNQVMEEIRAVGIRVGPEKITGQDVTEEFIDLEARITNQRALESQFIEIMKRAVKVED